MFRKHRGDSQIIVALILILVAVTLVTLFQKSITEALTKLIGAISDKIDALSGAATTTPTNP